MRKIKKNDDVIVIAGKDKVIAVMCCRSWVSTC